MIDLLFVAKNRREFTIAAAEALLVNTEWSKVDKIRIHDDGSSDGTREYLESLAWPVASEFRRHPVGGPVAVMNDFLSSPPGELFAKIDNDVLLPPHWLTECLHVMEAAPELDLLGIECTNDYPEAGSESSLVRRHYEPAKHIGGIGLMRRRAFRQFGTPQADGRMGFTQWQHAFGEVIKGWLKPSLPVALLDHLPMDPWYSLSESYIAKGWQRRGWGQGPEQYYGQKSHRLWSWWAGARQETAA